MGKEERQTQKKEGFVSVQNPREIEKKKKKEKKKNSREIPRQMFLFSTIPSFSIGKEKKRKRRKGEERREEKKGKCADL